MTTRRAAPPRAALAGARVAAALAALLAAATAAGDPAAGIELGSRPAYLVEHMGDGPLKERLLQCALVWRHSQCGLQETTDILTRPELAAKCQVPFAPARFGAGGRRVRKATATCCTSDLTLAEFKQLCGISGSVGPDATAPERFVRPAPRDSAVDAGVACGRC